MDKDQISVSDRNQKIMKSNQNGLLYTLSFMLNCSLVQKGTKMLKKENLLVQFKD